MGDDWYFEVCCGVDGVGQLVDIFVFGIVVNWNGYGECICVIVYGVFWCCDQLVDLVVGCEVIGLDDESCFVCILGLEVVGCVWLDVYIIRIVGYDLVECVWQICQFVFMDIVVIYEVIDCFVEEVF